MRPKVADEHALHVSLTLPGSASLGAFQAGAVSALTVAFGSLTQRGTHVSIDAVGGASAGSIIALLTAHGLLTGRDVPSLLADAWVDEVDLDVFRGAGAHAPLHVGDLRDDLVEFLQDRDDHPMRVHQPLDEPIALHVGLTSLLGFTIPVEIGSGRNSSLSFADWTEFHLRPEHSVDDLVEPVDSSPLDAVLASASHPVAFAPRQLDRSDDGDVFDDRGITNVDGSEPLWYTDGGLVESRPIGRVLRATRARHGRDGGDRVHLVVDPRSSGPTATDGWRGDSDHAWIEGLRRAMSIVPTQALHDDVRTVAATNARIEDFERAIDELRSRCPHADLDDIVDDLRAAADLTDKEHVDLEVISPLRRDTDDDVDDLLAGDFAGAFGGFLDRRLRQSDYTLGWRSTTDWIPGMLGRHGLSDATIDAVCDALQDRRPSWMGDVDLDGDGVDQLGRRGRLRLALLAAQLGRVVWSSATPPLRQFLPGKSP